MLSNKDLALFACFTLVSACGLGSSELTKQPRPFNSQEWKSAEGDARCDMVDDLLDRVGLVGRSREEVIALLGEPETHDDPPDHYHLCPSFTDVWILEIRWKDGNVASTNIRDT